MASLDRLARRIRNVPGRGQETIKGGNGSMLVRTVEPTG